VNIDKPKLIIIAAPNGSGKTSVTGEIFQYQWIENCLDFHQINLKLSSKKFFPFSASENFPAIA
jgi:predicted ABC-type ATPase